MGGDVSGSAPRLDRAPLRVWVARPLPAGARTAARVAALGHAPLLAPVLDLAPSHVPPPDGRFDALILTSANAAPALGPAGLTGLPAFCVGARTAEAARAAGLREIREAGGDAASLVGLITGSLPPGAALLHAAGRERKPEPAASLAAAGFPVTTWIAYAARPLPQLPDPVAAALAEARLDAALHYSRRSAAAALGLARAAGCEAGFARLAHLCLSEDCAAPLVAAGILSHLVAAMPTEDALLSGLTPFPSAQAGSRLGRDRC
ncbi:Uroporphyrinogen III synthase HEM4 [Methylobacterium sp. 4-46]|uniref:uroporphyrinogen-III synthase n=1 Tax=unclassified Methylobacterium TaxID=2615210 RepID=UPI000165CDC3|nr:MULTISPECIES: uroporphyrinogen-III synthase [Methylobacterium]ACA18875.1 Uroporphyrinogen III synthase HEM4 [Methylobacterium sp. 4-46]WFT78100.1 uroporphyrinogen-III synthase [Methylobacterium nodulans]